MGEVVDVLLRARADISQVSGSFKDLQKQLGNLSLPKGVSDNLEKSFTKLTPLIKDYQKQLNKGFSTQKDLKNFEILREKIDNIFSEIESEISQVNAKEVRLKVDTQALNSLKKQLSESRANIEKYSSEIFKVDHPKEDIKQSMQSLQNALNNTFKTGKLKFPALSEIGNELKKAFNTKNYAGFNNTIDSLKNKILSLSETGRRDIARSLGLKEAEKDIKSVDKALITFLNNMSLNKNAVKGFDKASEEARNLEKAIKDIETQSVTNGIKGIESAAGGLSTIREQFRGIGEEATEAGKGSVRMAEEVKQLQQSTQYFFSLRNMINLLRRGIDDAIQSVKELDKAMTDTAVVTDFSVGDMWKDLPKYTQLANELGATTKGAYETMTLYYQQGLDQQQAFALGAETMKMARIAGLDYAETTDMMTAALRGFNMELDETSAKRVNDVYSKLAAITASDTEELGTAMQRTASIAASAGASFEGTTAFLAQAIETTREPAENIGTAMKTIVARFQEMKKNPLEISEVDGEEVDYNKIDAALKTIGVDLKDTNGQFRDFDQVMLDISAKWDTLSQSQQRYIATTAAGSRQQSRFIAMVSDYDRTMQLMEAANNSAGASEEQFGKTAESLEFKLNKLHNAWELFTMGIANNSIIKGAVDGITTLLTVINNLIDGLSLGIGPVKSFLSLLTAFTGLKAGGRLVNSLIGGLGGLIDPQSSVKEGFKGGFFGGREQLQADRISNPIVKAIYSLIPHIDKSAVQNSQANTFQKPGDYKGARNFLKTSGFLRDGISLKNVSDIFDAQQLNKEQQAAFLKASPGLRSMLSKQLGKIYEQAGASPEVHKGMIAGFKKGIITLDQALSHESLYESFSDKVSRMEPAKADAFRESYRKQFEQEAKAQGVNVDEYKRQAFAALKFPKEGVEELMKALNERSPMEKFQDGLGVIGAGLMSTGSTLQMWGATLSETNPILGQFATGLGNTLTQVGSLINTIPALMNPWTLGLAAVGALIAVEEVRLNNIRTTAEEVTKTFEETNKTTQDNIATLKSYKSELATLSQGVDINGNNVNLSDSDYERYLEIVDSIAQINPEIVQGYNAQGHAIIDNNNALSDTLAKLEDIQKTTLNDYIDDDSLQKLIDARNIDKNFIGATTTITGTSGTHWEEEQGLAGVTRTKAAPMTSAVTALLSTLDRQKGLDDKTIDSILQGYNISLEQLRNGEDKAISTFVKNQDQINAQIGSKIVSSGNEIDEAVTKSFDSLREQTDNFDTAIQPVLQNLQTYVSNNPAFKNIAPEFQTALMSGLKDIVIQPDLDATQMQDQARTLIQEFDNLSAEGSDYAKAMQQVEQAQNDFAESLDAKEYAKGTEKALQTLDHLMSQYAGKTDAYSQAIAEYLQTQMDKIRNFTEDSGVSLSQAMNGVTDTIAAAEGAYSSFQDSTKTDLATGKDSMKSIFDEITKETDGVALHMEKFGDGTMWKGARALLGDKFVEENADNIDTIKKELRSLEPELKAGEEGFAAFWNSFSQVSDKDIKGFTWNDDGSYKIDRNVNPDVYEQIADAMHRSEEYVVAMLNAGKQFADIDFHQVEDVRKALSTDEAAIKNDGKIFVKSDYYENALDEAKIYNPNERRNIKEQDKAAGIIEIKDPDKITKDDFRSMGIDNLPNLIKTFGDTGQFNRDEIAQYAEALGNSGLIDYNPNDFDTEYQHYLDTQEHPELQPIESIESTVQRIAGLIDRNNVLEGNYSKEDEDTAQALYDSVIGRAGTDTATQYFGEGKNEAGNRLLTSKEFVDTYANLGKIAADAEEKANTYYKGAEAAEAKGDTEVADKLTKIGDLYAAVQKSTLTNQQEGKQTWTDEYARQTYESKLQELENSGLDNAAIKAEAARAWQEAFDAAKATINTAEGKEGTNQEIHQAVQEQAQALSQSNASNEQIKASMVEAANKMAEAQMKPGEIASELNKAYGTNLTGKDVNIGQDGKVGLTLDESKLQEQLSNLHADVEANITGINMGGGGGHAARASGQNNPNSIFRYHGTMARGSSRGYIISGRPTLTGEEGEELVWEPKRNEAYMVGSNGPQFANISKDAVVWNAAQTKRIKKNSKVGSFGTGARGISRFGTMAGGTGLKIPGTLDVDAKATIQDIALPEKEFTIPAKVDLQDKTAIEDIDATATVTRVEKAAKVSGEPIQVQATASTTKVDKTSKPKVSAGTQTMNVTANTGAAQAKINQLINLFKKTYTLKYRASGPSSIKVPISADFRGSWKKTVEISKGSGANGINNRGFGSLAGGKGRGTVGPNNRGGLTLTGEKGFEIAWLPSENRSMILGVNGPQMLNLPKDAVVWTHEQSKKILKQKTIPTGSMDRGSYTPSSGISYSNNSSTAQSVKKTSNSVKKSATDAAAAVKKVSVWWENIARKTELAQRIQDKNQKAFEKYLKEMRATLRTTGESLKSGGGGGDDYLASIGRTLGYYEAQLEKVNKELKNLDTAWAPTKQKDREKLYGQEGHENIVQVSYKNGKNTKEDLINLAGYIKQEDGTYVVDQKALDKIANKDLRKAVADAANKEINDRLSKKYKAEDEIEKAQEAIEKMGEELYKTFFGWEVELTKIWNITQKIEQTEARISQFKGYSDLLESQLSTGMATAGKDFAAQSLQAFQAGLQQQMRQIDLSLQSLDQKRTDLSNLISLDDEKETLTNIQNKLIENIKAQDQIATTEAQMNKDKAASDKATKDRQTVENRQKSIVTEINNARKQTQTGSKSARKKAAQKLAQLLKEQQTLPDKLATAKNTEAAAIKAYENAKTAYENAGKGATLNDTEKLGYEEYAKELEKTISTQAKAWEFMTATQMADGTVNVTFDSEAFEAEKFAGNITEEQGKAIQDYVKSIVDESKSLSQQYVDATSLINDMYGSLGTLQDSWADYANELWDISEAEQKKEVENAKKLSDSITNSLKNLLDEVKRKLDERRQQEDNAKTERDISQKQQRLAMLRADTAGGHQVEIAQLEREIAEAQQSYQRSLEDQLLDKLQQQADLAAEQRERQIALQEATISEINNAAQVNQWMSNPEAYRAEIYEAFKAANEYDKKPEALQAQLDNKFNTLFNGLLTNQQEQALITDGIKTLEGQVEQISAQMSEFAHLSGAITALVATITQTGSSSGTSTINKPTDLTSDQTTANRIEATVEALKPQTSAQSQDDDKTAKEKAYRTTIDAIHKAKKIDKTTLKDVLAKGTQAGYKWAQVAYDLAAGDGQGGISWAAVIKAAKKAGYKKDLVAQWSPKTGQPQKDFQNAFKKWNKYASGGLADYTGPAWLDGTPSRPELVLNKKDTQNFLALRDVLSSAMKSTGAVTNSYGGDVMYDINIHVDKIEKDYDVDRVVDKVKKEIVKGAGYRNVTQVRNFK